MMMKRTTVKRALALLLTAVLLLPVGVLGMAVSAKSAYVPVIYIAGDTDIKYRDEDGVEHEVYDDGEYIETLLSNAIGDFAKGVVTGDWEAYSQKALDVFLPAYEHYAPDLEGNFPPESYVDWEWRPEWIAPNRANIYNVNYENCYVYRLDKRMSPLDMADDLERFVQTIKEKTGQDKVAFFARCLGPVALYAWLYEYARPRNYADVDSIVITATTANGVDYGEACYTGNVVITEEAARNYLLGYYTWDDIVGGALAEFLNAAVPVLRTSYGLTIGVKELNKIYTGLKDVFFAKLIKAYYGRQLGFMACVKDNFDDMIPYLYGEEGDDVKYAYYIDKLTEYHETVQAEIEDILVEMREDYGIDVNVIAYYGCRQAYPVHVDSNLTGDYQVGTRQQSFNATVSEVDKKLSDETLAATIAAGKEKYISPDRMIDASTCLFPDNTWFIRNCDHQWPAGMHELATRLIRNKGCDINTYEDYPQFLNLLDDLETVVPAQETNENDWHYTVTGEEKVEAYANFAQLLLDKLHSFLMGLMDLIRRLVSAVR